ncbi:MAG: LptF/LptG family permease [Pseudomonadota bacterium]
MIGNRIQRYVLMRYTIALSLVLIVFILTILLVDTVEQMRTLGGDIDLSPMTAVTLAAMKLPSLIEQTFPFAILIAAMMTFNQLSKTSELSVIRASGQSAWQFLGSVLAFAACLGALSMMLLNPFGAFLSERFETTRASLLQEGGIRAEINRENIWLRQGDDNSQILIYAKRVDETGLVFSDVKFIEEGRVFNGSRPTDDFVFVRRIDAAQARIIDGFWQLDDLIENIPGSQPQRMNSLAIETDLDPNTLLSRFTSPNTIGFWRLPGFVDQTNKAGLDASRFTMRWLGLTALPVLYMAMALIGALVCLRLSRLGGTSRLVAIGALGAIGLFFISQIAYSLGASGGVPPAIAAWSPALCALFVSLTILSYQEDG